MFQDPNALWMVTLGTLGDSPPNGLQPPLDDGMHLRWTFQPARGFPWYGYYLFRRPSSREPRERCIRPSLKGIQSGQSSSNQLFTNVGTLVSDRPLVFTNDFPPAGFAEVDLENRQYVALRLPPAQPAWRAHVSIGFRKDGEGGAKQCIDFRDEDEGKVENPLFRDDTSFASFDSKGNLKDPGRFMSIGGATGWDAGFLSEIKLACPSRRVYVTLRSGSEPAKIEAIDTNGDTVAVEGMTGFGPETVVLAGKNIALIRIHSPQNETVLMQFCWVCQDEEGPEKQEILVRAVLQGVTVAQQSLSGGPGDVVDAMLTADSFDEVVVGPGDAALIDLCVVPVLTGIGSGWEALDDFEYPLCLPVAHGDYPCPGAPGSFANAESRALGRIRYGDPGQWQGQPFSELHDRMERLIVGGPPSAGGEPMDQRFDIVTGSPPPPAGSGGAIMQRVQRPLDLLLLGSLQPPIAEMLGLAWLDRSAVPGEHYDYLLIADHEGSLGGKASSAINWLETIVDFTTNDGFIAYDRVVAPAPPLPAPQGLEIYSLPGATAGPPGAPIDATNNAGLRWNRQEVLNVLAPGAPIMYHAWRANLGNAATPQAPADGDFDPITKSSPLPVSRAILSPPATPVRPDDWPPFALYYIDRARPDGWYAYRVSGIDIFGRHSESSASGAWRQWAPAPSTRPWYYVEPPGNQVIHPAAVRLLDKTAPPPPPGVEAFALDPEDPGVLRDAAWIAWQASLSAAERANVIGLRVRWLWTAEQQLQAPDVREFRVYYHPAPLNTLRGRVTSVIDVSASESRILTDIPNTQPANSYAGLSVRVESESFRIVGSEAGSPLQLRVKNIGPTDNIRPPAGVRCALNLTPGHALYVDFARAQPWQTRMLTVGFSQHVTLGANGLRRYEVFLPVAGSSIRTGLPLVTTLDEPVALGAIAVTSADDKQHTPDHRGDPARFGNESRTGGPATVLRIRRVPPAPPPVPPDSPRLFASPADYHGHSYFTYRWAPSPRLRTFVYRALDEAIFRRDFALRPRPALLASDLQFFPPQAVDPAWNLLKRQQVAAELNALNTLAGGGVDAALNSYRSLSNDGLRVLAALPGTEAVFVQVTQQALDPAEPEATAPNGLRWRRVGPDVAPNVLGASERAWVDQLDGRGNNRWFYRSAYVDEVYNIGAMGLSSPPVWLPNVTPPRAPMLRRIRGGDRQITIEWASNREPDLVEYRVYRTDDPAKARDLRLMTLVQTLPVPPGDPAARPPGVSWTDTPVPGLVTFNYRLVAVDDAGNVSDPSPAQHGRAHDQSLPEPPAPVLGWVTVGTTTRAQLEWTSDHEVLVQRQVENGTSWIDLTTWRPAGTVSIRDPFSEPSNTYTYRLWARKYTGAVVRGAPIQLEAQ